MLTIPIQDMFRPKEGENLISFVSPLTGPNYLLFTMHWTKTEDGRFRPYVCPRYFGSSRCPICEKANITQDPAERKEYIPRTRVVLNVWDMKGEPTPIIWDVSHFLLKKALQNGEIANPVLWNPGKDGMAVHLINRRATAGWPEYTTFYTQRNIDIPRPIIARAYDLRSIIRNAIAVPNDYVITSYGNTDQVVSEKDKVAQIVGEKKPAYQRKVRRKIIMD